MPAMTSSLRLCNRIFSGIQPTGVPHLGNYFGAIAQWIRITNERKISKNGKVLECDTPVFSIVDVHSYTSNSTCFGSKLYDNILATTASLLALGLDPNKCILFRQSDIMEHNYLDNVLDNFVTPQRLTHMTQFKDKQKEFKVFSNGLLNYPILQAADILLYNANLVPVGEDQIQHIELTRDIAKKFNTTMSCDFFQLPEAVLDSSIYSRRLKSLRNPEKKMSKSDPNKKAFIGIVDEPDEILEKCKKALTDSTSAVYYDAEKRPGVSNLMRVYQLATGESFEVIERKFLNKETSQFKLDLADILIEKFKNAREEYKRLRLDRDYLEKILKLGESKAHPIARETILHVRHLLGSKRIN